MMLEEVLEPWLESGRLRRYSSAMRGSIASMLRFSQPCLVLTWARARLFCSARVICLVSVGPAVTMSICTLLTSARRMTRQARSGGISIDMMAWLV